MKIGIVPYFNVLPLVFFLKNYSFLRAHPKRLASLFATRFLHTSLLSSFQVLHQFHSSFVLNSSSISSYGPSGSVLLFLNQDISKIQSVGISQNSLSSQFLLKIILKNYLQLHCQFKIDSYSQLVNNPNLDAYLLIGNEALYHQNYHHQFLDLAQLWSQWTKTPFVFAVWVSKSPNLPFKYDLINSQNQGLKNIQKIVQLVPFPHKIWLNQYYLKFLSYDFGENEKKSLLLFQHKLYQNQFIKTKYPIRYF